MGIECNKGPICSVGSYICIQMVRKRSGKLYTKLILLERQEMNQNRAY